MSTHLTEEPERRPPTSRSPVPSPRPTTSPVGPAAAHDLANVPVHEDVARAVADGVAQPGRPLTSAERRGLPPHLAGAADAARLHTGPRAAASAARLDARAYTLGRDVVVGGGEHLTTGDGPGLLAHELAHVREHPGEATAAGARLGPDDRGRADASATPVGTVQRATLGTKFTHPTGVKSPYKKVTATFDGANFTVFGDTLQIMQVAAQSGRPYTVRPADAKSCGGSPNDTYLNNPLYVGIADNGPIPEGVFTFTATQFATFSTTEQLQMLPGGTFTDPFGVSLHGGDWGAGRAPLAPVRIVPAPPGHGSTTTRSGFYLHGGVMPGSSGCIDIGNGGVTQLLGLLGGYTGTVTVTVKYTAPPPSVGALGRAVGRFTYPKKKDAGLWDRIKAAAGQED